VYLFETRFCNVAKGNEKATSRTLQNAVSGPTCRPCAGGQPGPVGRKLFDDCQNDLRALVRKSMGQDRGELFEEEKPCLLALQSERFAACCRGVRS